MKKLLVVGVAMFLLYGCDMARYRVFRSYIFQYNEYYDVAVDTTEHGNIAIKYLIREKDKNKFSSYGWYSKGKAKEKYDELCKAHNDMSYNKKREYHFQPTGGLACAFDLISIDVISNANFDAAHPAGTSLNDIVRFVSFSSKKFIDSGYRDTFDWKKNRPEIFKQEKKVLWLPHEEESYFPVDKRLSEITLDDMKLMPGSFYLGLLVFEASPDIEKEHLLKITIKTNNGRTFTKTVTKKF